MDISEINRSAAAKHKSEAQIDAGAHLRYRMPVLLTTACASSLVKVCDGTKLSIVRDGTAAAIPLIPIPLKDAHAISGTPFF
jgi:hypothetical protein